MESFGCTIFPLAQSSVDVHLPPVPITPRGSGLYVSNGEDTANIFVLPMDVVPHTWT